ncbi:MAG: flagellar filament capping protein FliD [Treponema sp.]|jgi:flagellar hook-associated protein 2|nr:flagellar filament capping protein FliD [Treponema sp.]
MSEIFIPGINSRFNTQQLVDDLMRLERIPRDRAERNVDQFQSQRAMWDEVGRRTNALRDSARHLFSFQNPFNDRVVNSDNAAAISGTAVRGALEQERTFTVNQIAQADRFLSSNLDPDFEVEGGRFIFTVGEEEISFDFRGGSLSEFAAALNRQGGGLIQASTISVRQGTTSLLIESRLTGEENRLNFAGDAITLGEQIGMVTRVNDSRREFTEGVLNVQAGSSALIPLNFQPPENGNWVLSLETSTTLRNNAQQLIPQPPPGPAIPSPGAISHGGIVVQNAPSGAPLPAWTPPPVPPRVDDMNMLSVTFSDGSSAMLAPIADSQGFNTRQFALGDLAQGRTITALSLVNNNTHRDLHVQGVQIFDPAAIGGVRALNAVSSAQDAIIAMEGIEIRRPSNQIDDLLPGVTLTARRVTSEPVTLTVEPDREAILESIINFVGNYNRLMAEINILTRSDPRVVDELAFLTNEERAEALDRLGSLSGNSTLNHMRNSLMRVISSPFPTSAERELALLSQIGIGTDVRWGGATGGIDASRLRGYLEIDEQVLISAIENNAVAIRELFGSDTTGNRLVDTGVAFSVDALTHPFTQIGGIIPNMTGNLDTRIVAENRRIENMDRRLEQREIDLRRQYAQMEEAFRRMEQMTGTLDRFNNQGR